MFKQKPIEVAINIPSGRIAFADDLRFAYPVPDHEGSPQNANGPLWQKIITEGYGRVGLFHGYVGNSCPSIHRHNGILIIGNPSYDSKDYEPRDDLPGKHIGSICTDLWWYSIADYDDLAARMHKMGKNISDINLDGTVKVKPGRYILRHYYPYFSESHIKHNDGVEIYATLHKSDKEIKPLILPEEGLADLLMERPDITYTCVEHGGGEVPIYSAYKILLSWIGNIFTHPEFTANEIINIDLVIEGVYKGYEVEYKEREDQKKSMRKFNSKLTPEHREQLMQRIFQELDREIKEIK